MLRHDLVDDLPAANGVTLTRLHRRFRMTNQRSEGRV